MFLLLDICLFFMIYPLLVGCCPFRVFSCTTSFLRRKSPTVSAPSFFSNSLCKPDLASAPGLCCDIPNRRFERSECSFWMTAGIGCTFPARFWRRKVISRISSVPNLSNKLGPNLAPPCLTLATGGERGAGSRDPIWVPYLIPIIVVKKGAGSGSALCPLFCW